MHADGHNSDYSPVVGRTDLDLGWQRSFDGMINLGATFDGLGRVYVTTSAPGCHLYVLDPATGATVWCSEAVDRLAVISSALLDQHGRAYLADSQAMHAFDPDGNEIWRTPIVGVPLSAQFTSEGRIIFVTHVGVVYVLDRETGTPVLAPVELIPGAAFDPAAGVTACAMGRRECPSANTPAIDAETGRLIFTFWSPDAPHAELRAMRYTEDPAPALMPLWINDDLPGGSASSPDLSADGRRVYVNDNAGNVHALDAATGEEIWSYTIGYAAAGSSSLSPDGLIMPAGAKASAALALADLGDRAELRWSNGALLNRGVATQAAGGLAYVTCRSTNGANDLVVVDTADGRELDRVALPGITLFTVGTTIADNGWVFVPSFNGHLFALRPA